MSQLQTLSAQHLKKLWSSSDAFLKFSFQVHLKIVACKGMEQDINTQNLRVGTQRSNNSLESQNKLRIPWHFLLPTSPFASSWSAPSQFRRRVSARDQIFTLVNTLPSTHILCKLHLKPAEWNVYKSFSSTSLVQNLSISFLVPVPLCWMDKLMNRPGRTVKRQFEVFFATRLCARSNRKPPTGVWRELFRGFLFLRKLQSTISTMVDCLQKGLREMHYWLSVCCPLHRNRRNDATINILNCSALQHWPAVSG